RAAATPKCSLGMGSTRHQSRGQWLLASRDRFRAMNTASCSDRRPSPDSFRAVRYPDRIFHWIDDAEIGARSAATFEKRSPINDRQLAEVARGAAVDVALAV